MQTTVETRVSTNDLRVDLTGRTAIVTGAASGIGSAIASRFAQAGACVVVDYPDEASRTRAVRVVEGIRRDGGRALAVSADVTSEAGADHLVAAAVQRFGGLDILVNNAGIEKPHPLVEMPLDVWERTVRVNLTGAFLCARAAARAMVARGTGGRIINISSVHESLAMPGNSAYAASKGGIRMFMRTVALELAEHGITVNDIAPGAIATPINRDVRTNSGLREELLDEIPLRRVGDADEVAALASYLASSAAGYVTGATYAIDGGLMRNAKGL